MFKPLRAAGLGFFLYMILITYASVTAQEVASEKGTKIMEVVFSSIRASHYFYARMLAFASCDFDSYWHLRRGWAGCHSAL